MGKMGMEEYSETVRLLEKLKKDEESKGRFVA